MRSNGQVTALCDFCNAPGPEWEYPVSGQITTTSPLTGRPLGYGDEPWAACSLCAAMIDEQRYGDLLERTIRLGPKPGTEFDRPHAEIGNQAIREQKAELYAAFSILRGPRQQVQS